MSSDKKVPPPPSRRGAAPASSPAARVQAASRTQPHDALGAAADDLMDASEKGCSSSSKKRPREEDVCSGTGPAPASTARHLQVYPEYGADPPRTNLELISYHPQPPHQVIPRVPVLRRFVTGDVRGAPGACVKHARQRRRRHATGRAVAICASPR